jgi:hypothetical protein
MTSPHVDPWLAGKQQLAQTRANGKVAKIKAKADREARREQRKEQRANEQRKRWKQRRDALRNSSQAQADSLLWLAIMGTPMVLAWSSMSAFGVQVYGPLGAALPLLSEGATLHIARSIPRRLRDGKPVALLRIGLVLFAAIQAVLNFAHGSSGMVSVAFGQPAPGSVGHGVVMALVSLSGVAVHQMLHGRQPKPRRTGEQRRTARKLARVRRVAIRQAVTEVDENGQAQLVHRPGRYVLTRHGFRRGFRLELNEAVVPAAPVPVPELGAELADEVSEWLAEHAESWTGSERGERLSTAETGSGPAPGTGRYSDPRVPELVAHVQAAVAAGTLQLPLSRRKVRRFLHVSAATAGEVMDALRGDGPSGVPVP